MKLVDLKYQLLEEEECFNNLLVNKLLKWVSINTTY